jgi:hypothetical protein
MWSLGRLILISAVVVATAGCPNAGPAPSPSPSPRPASYFDQKVRCAAVGERWEKAMCDSSGRRNPACNGWWVYSPQRDTCVGVFHDISFEREAGGRSSRIESLFVFDMLTNVELEDGCVTMDNSQRCNVEGAKKRWITPAAGP